MMLWRTFEETTDKCAVPAFRLSLFSYYNSEHSSRRAKRVVNEVSSTVENMIKEK